MKLPARYDKLTSYQRRKVREQYVDEQNGLCWACYGDLKEKPTDVMDRYSVDLRLFPPGFLKYPVHLQHNHDTGLTEGAVHSYCNAVLWQYMDR